MSNFAFVFSGGTVVRDLDTYYGITSVMQITGAGMAPVTNNRVPYGLSDGSLYQSTIVTERIVMLACVATSTTLPGLHRIRKRLIADINNKALNNGTFILRYRGAGTEIDLPVRYDGGLEGMALDGLIDKFVLRLLAVQPFWQGTIQQTVTLAATQTLTNGGYLAYRTSALVWAAFAASGAPAAAITSMIVSTDATIVYVSSGVYVYKYSAGAWSTIGTFDAAVNVVALGRDGTTLYAGGLFTTTAAPSTGGGMIMVAKYSSGVAWVSMAGLTVPGTSGVTCLASDSRNYLHAGGTFTTAAAVGCYGLARWTGAAWAGATSLAVSNEIDSISIDSSDNVYVGTGTAYTIDYLIVGGGGAGGGAVGGGSNSGGGGGAGGILTAPGFAIATTSYAIVVGASSSGAGNNSTALGFTANGGGRGGSSTTTGAATTGGSGGGGAYSGGSYSAGAAGTGGQGNAGANGGATSGGGGGGAGTTGAAGSGTSGGSGGSGLANSYSGGSVTYAAGGGGGSYNGTVGGAGGSSGVGGTGSGGTPAGIGNASAGTAGAANTGSGGGGEGFFYAGGNGASGIVIIRYLTASGMTATGGTITTSGAYTIHTFTSNGTWAPNATTAGAVVKYTSAFTTYTAITTLMNGACAALAIAPNGNVYAGGDFTLVSSTAAARVAYWNGTVWAAVGSGFGDGRVKSIAFDTDGTVHAAGTFTLSNAASCSYAGVYLGGANARWVQELLGSPPTACTVVAVDKNNQLYLAGYSSTAITVAGVTSITNSGDFDSGPKITITRSGGTTARLKAIVNQFTGKKLLFDYPLLDGETVTIDASASQRTVYSTGSANLLGQLFTNSNFDTFAVSGGTNNIFLHVVTTGSPTITAALAYYRGYWGVDSIS